MAAGKLTPKQERFVAEYLIDLNATAAYQRAGYAGRGHSAEVCAHLLLKKPHVQAAVAEANAKRLKRVALTADDVLKRLEDLADGAERDADKLRALELIGKHLKLFTEKVEHSGEVRVIDPYARPLADG